MGNTQTVEVVSFGSQVPARVGLLTVFRGKESRRTLKISEGEGFRENVKGGKAKVESNRSNAILKRKGTDSQRAGKKAAKNATKDPNKPKRPSSAFFVFMEEFRVQYKRKHPNNKSVAAVGMTGGDKWKSLSDDEKAPYIAKSEKRKEEYNKKMQAYNKRTDEGENAADDDEFDKSKSEVNDEEGDAEAGNRRVENHQSPVYLLKVSSMGCNPRMLLGDSYSNLQMKYFRCTLGDKGAFEGKVLIQGINRMRNQGGSSGARINDNKQGEGK